MCEPCHRLAALGQFCPVCKRLYRQTDKSPMVCCDLCSRWVHIECDGISPAEYQLFANSDRPFSCPDCRVLPPSKVPALVQAGRGRGRPVLQVVAADSLATPGRAAPAR
jgi:hypothetical protein